MAKDSFLNQLIDYSIIQQGINIPTLTLEIQKKLNDLPSQDSQIFLNRSFWSEKHHFKLKKRGYF
jgi:hypothetical protein